MMRTAIFCYAPADERVAREIGEYFEANCPSLGISYGEAIVQPGFDLVDAIERGLSAEVAIVLLSKDSVPVRPARDRWEPVIGDARDRVLFVLLGECAYPELFRKRYLFSDYGNDPVGARRALKRWMFSGDLSCSAVADPRVRELAAAIVDRPGIADVPQEHAVALAGDLADDFEAVFHINGTRRTIAGVLGDTAHALGRRLPGSPHQNQIELHRSCYNRRFLFVYTNVAPECRDAVMFGGMCSVLFTEAPVAPPKPLDVLVASFSFWRRNREECLRSLGDAQYHLARGGALKLGWAVDALLRDEGRIAERHEVVGWMLEAARDTGDRAVEQRLAWDRNWIEQDWDTPQPPAPILPFPNADQFAFDFAAGPGLPG